MQPERDEIDTVRATVDAERLLATAEALIDVPSPTRSAGPVADRLAQLLAVAGFPVERPDADWPESPAVVPRLSSGRRRGARCSSTAISTPYTCPTRRPASSTESSAVRARRT